MSRIHVEDRFDEFGRDFDRTLRTSLHEAALVTQQEAKSLAPKGDTGRLSSRIHTSTVESTLHTYRVYVYAAMFYGRFLEFGTLGKRTRKLKQPGRRRQEAGEGSGIEPRYFMLHAGRSTADALVEILERNLRRL